MKPINIKMTIDSAMTIGLLLLMGYGAGGQVIHEWIGVGCSFVHLAPYPQ